MILRSDYIYCIYFHLFLLYNLKFSEYSVNVNGHGDGHSRVKTIGVNIKNICQGGSHFFRGSYFYFSMECVKYQKVTKCKSVI